MKKAAVMFAAGYLAALGTGVWMGGEAVTRLGLRMIAASSDYDWQAVPKESVAVSYDTRELLAWRENPVHAKGINGGKKGKP